MEKGGQPNVGIIMRLRKDTNTLQVIGLVPDGPAKKSGMVQENDAVLKVAGQDVAGMSGEVVSQLLSGKSGSRVRIKLSREGVSFDVTLTRAMIASTPQAPVMAKSKKAAAGSDDGSNRGGSRNRKLTDREKADKLLGKGINKVYAHDGGANRRVERVTEEEGARARARQDEAIRARQQEADADYEQLMDSELAKAKAQQAEAKASIHETAREANNQIWGSLRALLGFGSKESKQPSGEDVSERSKGSKRRSAAQSRDSGAEQPWFAKLNPFSTAPEPVTALAAERQGWNPFGKIAGASKGLRSKVKETKKRTAAYAVGAYLEHRIAKVNAELWDAAWGSADEGATSKKKRGGAAAEGGCGLCTCSARR